MKLVMMGTGTFAEPTFEALLRSAHQVVGLVTQPDRATGNVRASTRQTGKGMKDIALERGIPVYQPDSINTPAGVAHLQAWSPDLLVVAAYGQILAGDVLEAAARGGINVHASLLPKYRGAAPVAWAIANGETHTGVTIIRMTTGLDAGDMLAQTSLPILPEETAGELEARLARLGADLAVGVVDRLAQGDVPGTKQDRALVTRAPKLTKEHGLIDWSRTAAEIDRHLRAMQPWPTPYTFLHRPDQQALRLLVLRARPNGGDCPEEPGTLLQEGSVLKAAAGAGTLLEILEVQPAGKRRMAAAEFLRGYPVVPGAHLGPERPA